MTNKNTRQLKENKSVVVELIDELEYKNKLMLTILGELDSEIASSLKIMKSEGGYDADHSEYIYEDLGIAMFELKGLVGTIAMLRQQTAKLFGNVS